MDGKAYNKRRDRCVNLIRWKRKNFLIILAHVISQMIKPFGRQ